MARIAYETWNPRESTSDIIAHANRIAGEYSRQGYQITLRQLYYQFVAADLLPNKQESYDKLGSIVNKARLAGMLDWRYIVDRERNLQGLSHWSTPGSVISSAAYGYRLDHWTTQKYRVEVWVEKQALIDVIARAAQRWDVDYFACKGYVSQSEMWSAAQRLGGYVQGGQSVILLHLGDHDPSGLDMTRDIDDRLHMFMSEDIGSWQATTGLEVRRIALTAEQIEQYQPPPNPAKLTDVRAPDYVERFGNESWELDALPPNVLDELISTEIESIVDMSALEVVRERERVERAKLTLVAEHWDDVSSYVDEHTDSYGEWIDGTSD
jgi:hypothetical protein